MEEATKCVRRVDIVTMSRTADDPFRVMLESTQTLTSRFALDESASPPGTGTRAKSDDISKTRGTFKEILNH